MIVFLFFFFKFRSHFFNLINIKCPQNIQQCCGISWNRWCSYIFWSSKSHMDCVWHRQLWCGEMRNNRHTRCIYDSWTLHGMDIKFIGEMRFVCVCVCVLKIPMKIGKIKQQFIATFNIRFSKQINFYPNMRHHSSMHTISDILNWNKEMYIFMWEYYIFINFNPHDDLHVKVHNMIIRYGPVAKNVKRIKQLVAVMKKLCAANQHQIKLVCNISFNMMPNIILPCKPNILI